MLLKPITTSLAADSTNPLYAEEFYTIQYDLCIGKELSLWVSWKPENDPGLQDRIIIFEHA